MRGGFGESTVESRNDVGDRIREIGGCRLVWRIRGGGGSGRGRGRGRGGGEGASGIRRRRRHGGFKGNELLLIAKVVIESVRLRLILIIDFIVLADIQPHCLFAPQTLVISHQPLGSPGDDKITIRCYHTVIHKNH